MPEIEQFDPHAGAGELGRVARRRARVRQRLLEVAEKLMEERGVEAVTIDDIAAGAEIARRSFYHHFESKYDLLVPIARARTRTVNLRLERLAASIADPAEAMAAAIRHGLRAFTSDPLCNWFILESGLSHERLYEGVGESANRDAQRGVAAGRFRIDNPKVAGLIISASFIALLSANLAKKLRERDLDDAVAYLLRLLGLDSNEAHDIAHRPLSPLPRAKSQMNPTS